MNFIEEVNSYEDVCNILQKDPWVRPDVSAYDDEDKQAAIASFILWRASKAAWNGVKIDWNDWDQYKYTIWFDLRDVAGSGSRFSYDYCGCDHVDSIVGARLVWPDRESAKHAAKVFEKEFKALFKIE